ncbi:uncharacterized protein LOC127669352 [Apodemus sylvaticus]|uniref:uncharacterized protein LOC127669352 n=1 Tax=Apodemus sylvaticus TaxID=10129 RepID=UPI002243586A|nr:uncharacterized protein LOC127669352 [Apodemus sylvaticus]
MIFLVGLHLHKTMPGKLEALTLQSTLSLPGQLCSLHHAEDVDKAKEMMQSSPSFDKDTLNSEEHVLISAPVLPAMSTSCSMSYPHCFCGESSHCSEDGWFADWDLYSFCVFESVDNLRYYQRFNCAMKKSTDVSQILSQRNTHVASGDVNNNNQDKDIEEVDQPSPSLLREKGLELETYDGGDCPDQDPVSDSPRNLRCWAWLQKTFGQKNKKK